MKVATLLAAVSATLPVAESIALNRYSRSSNPRVISMDIQKHSVADPVKSSNDRFKNRKRATITQTLDNEATFYFANATLGTPAQNFKFTLDTGSSDLWTNAPNSTLCSRAAKPCADSGTYDASASTSSTFVNSDFNITYADGSGAAGDYLTDTLTIGGQTLNTFQFGVGYTSSSSQGVLGIGYGNNEVAVRVLGQDTPYNNLPLAMTKAGLISTPAYSLWLNDLYSSTGQILFGGVNKDKYIGELHTMAILQEPKGYYTEFLITMTGLSYSSGSSTNQTFTDSVSGAVLLDSGSSLSYLPDALVTQVYNAIGADYVASAGAAYVPCSLTGSFTFTFSNASITVDMDELLFGAADTQGNPLTFSDGTQACIFGIMPAGSSTSVLGDTFLRSAYVVYDLNNNEISLAQTHFNSTSDNIVEISGSSSLPSGDASSSTSSSTSSSGAMKSISTQSVLGFVATGVALFFASL